MIDVQFAFVTIPLEKRLKPLAVNICIIPNVLASGSKRRRTALFVRSKLKFDVVDNGRNRGDIPVLGIHFKYFII